MLACNIYQRKKYSLSVFACVLFTLLLTAAGVFGAKLMFFAESGFRSWDGISFFGSVFLIPVLMSLVGLFFRLTPGRSLDLCAPCVAVMIAVLRVNCFLSGCCGGWSVCVGSYCFSWPTQIVESLGDVAILYYLLKRADGEDVPGHGYPWFMVLYGIMRFLLEFLRDTPKDWLRLSHGQWFALVSALFGGLVLLALKWKVAKNGTDI